MHFKQSLLEDHQPQHPLHLYSSSTASPIAHDSDVVSLSHPTDILTNIHASAGDQSQSPSRTATGEERREQTVHTLVMQKETLHSDGMSSIRSVDPDSGELSHAVPTEEVQGQAPQECSTCEDLDQSCLYLASPFSKRPCSLPATATLCPRSCHICISSNDPPSSSSLSSSHRPWTPFFTNTSAVLHVGTVLQAALEATHDYPIVLVCNMDAGIVYGELASGKLVIFCTFMQFCLTHTYIYIYVCMYTSSFSMHRGVEALVAQQHTSPRLLPPSTLSTPK